MSHMLAGTLCLAGFAALACATRRQQRDLFGGSLRRSVTYLLRTIGAVTLLAALAILVAGNGWSIGLVMFSGHTSLAAGVVYAGLIGLANARAALRNREL